MSGDVELLASHPCNGDAPPVWYAIQTRPKHEKSVATQLGEQGVQVYLPTVKEIHRWSDRKKLIELPLFPGYEFVRIAHDHLTRVAILRIWGVLNFVGEHNQGTPIPDDEIHQIEMLLTSKVAMSPCPFVRVGQRVIVHGGALEGLEGTVVRNNGKKDLVVQVNAIERAVLISLDGYDVRPV